MFVTARCLVVWSAVTTAAGLVASYAVGTVVHGATSGRFDGAVAAVAGAALAGCAAWSWLVCTVVVVAALRDRDDPHRPVRGVPAWVVRAVLAACGAAALTTAPAHAADVDGPRPVTPTSRLHGLPFPDRPVGPAAAAGAAHRQPATPGPPASVVVRAGDSLWAIAAARLGPGATDAEVAAATAELYALNRDAVGPDPDLIHPGLRLRSPGR